MVTIDDARSLPFALRRDVEAQRRLYAVLSSPKRMFMFMASSCCGTCIAPNGGSPRTIS